MSGVERAHADTICTSPSCPIGSLLHHNPGLCAPLDESKPLEADASLYDALHELPPYATSVWGPEWIATENAILGMSDEISESDFCLFRVYLSLKARFMTCPNCQRHFRAALDAMPNDRLIRTRAGLLVWWTRLHNEVNARRHQHVHAPHEIIHGMRTRALDEARVTVSIGDEKKKIREVTVRRPPWGIGPRWGAALLVLAAVLGVVAVFVARSGSRMVKSNAPTAKLSRWMASLH
jgi:hypothetical protein